MAEVSLSEELDALRAVYCKPQEFQERISSEGHYITINFDTSIQTFKLDMPHKCGLSFMIPPGYPQLCPVDLAVFCDLMTIEELSSLQRKVEEKLNDLKGDSMLLELCCFVHDSVEDCISRYSVEGKTDSLKSNSGANSKVCNVPNKSHECPRNDSISGLNRVDTDQYDSTYGCISNVTDAKQNEDLPSNIVTSVLQLDHMRSKPSYIKHIKKWTTDLALNGRLIFCKKFIFIILQGKSKDVKDYVIKNRTVNVDVDSKGRSCKERLLNILCEVSAKDHIKFTDFVVIDDVPSMDELSSLFDSFYMKAIYNEYVVSNLSFHAKKSTKS